MSYIYKSAKNNFAFLSRNQIKKRDFKIKISKISHLFKQSNQLGKLQQITIIPKR